MKNKFDIEPRTYTAKLVIYPDENMNEEITMWNTKKILSQKDKYDIEFIMPYDDIPVIIIRRK